MSDCVLATPAKVVILVSNISIDGDGPKLGEDQDPLQSA